MKILLFIFLAVPTFASGPYGFDDPKLNLEFEQNYKDHKFPKFVNATGSTMTVTFLNVSTVSAVQISATTGTINSFMVRGATSNNTPCEGCIGEYEESLVGPNIDAAASGAFDDLTSISLTAGIWDISASGANQRNTATWTGAFIGISTTTGNTSEGMAFGHNLTDDEWASSATTPVNVSAAIPRWRMSFAATTTVYLKRRMDYSAGTPRTQRAMITAVRVF